MTKKKKKKRTIYEFRKDRKPSLGKKGKGKLVETNVPGSVGDRKKKYQKPKALVLKESDRRGKYLQR